MKDLIPILCLLIAGVFYVGCSEDSFTQSTGEMEHAVVDGSHGEEQPASKGKPGSGGTYEIQIDSDFLGHGTATGAPGSDSGRGASLGEAAMEFTFEDPGVLCAEFEPTASGLFALVLKQSKHPPVQEVFTYASLSFFNFTGTDGKSYGIEFDVDPSSFTLDEWLPSGGGTAVHQGTGFVVAGPRRSPCNNASFGEDWTLTVTANQ